MYDVLHGEGGDVLFPVLDQSFGESLQDLARTAIEDQDNEIAQRSGECRTKIKSIARA